MTTSSGRHAAGTPRLLYRDRERGLVMGVCAGISEFFDWNLLAVRLIALVMLAVATLPTILVYFTAGFLLRDRPLRYRGASDAASWRDEVRFWRKTRQDYRADCRADYRARSGRI